MSTGALTLDQVAAAVPFATPESDAEIARIAIGKAPSQISRQARTIVPPKVADDQELYQRRALRMTWTNGGRELAFSGQLPLEQGAAFEQAIRERRQAAARRRQEARHPPRLAAIRRGRTRHARPPRPATLTMVCGAAPPR